MAKRHDRLLGQDVALISSCQSSRIYRSDCALQDIWVGESGLILIADGLGGHPKGRLASGTCALSFAKVYKEAVDFLPATDAAHRSHLRCIELSKKYGLRRPMGAALGGISWHRGKWVGYICGDVTVYDRSVSLRTPVLSPQRTEAGNLAMTAGGTWDTKKIEATTTPIHERSSSYIFVASDGFWAWENAEASIARYASGQYEGIFASVCEASRAVHDDATLVVLHGC